MLPGRRGLRLSPPTCALPQFRSYKIVYRRYAGLFFNICVDLADNNLAYLEMIHNFVEMLDKHFGNVCELDLVFNFYKVGAARREEGGADERKRLRLAIAPRCTAWSTRCS